MSASVLVVPIGVAMGIDVMTCSSSRPSRHPCRIHAFLECLPVVCLWCACGAPADAARSSSWPSCHPCRIHAFLECLWCACVVSHLMHFPTVALQAQLSIMETPWIQCLPQVRLLLPL